MLNKKIKTCLSLILMIGLFTINSLPAQAGLFGGGGRIKIPSASQVASELESRYHVNLGNIQEQGENFNVMENKKQGPEVQVFFSPSDPQEGEKLTAQALPMFFGN